MALLLCKRGVQFAAYFPKSSSSSSTSISRRCISRSLAESSNVKRVVNNNTFGLGGRWAVVGGAVRGYSGGGDDASSNQIQKIQLQEHLISALQLEVRKLRNEIERNEIEKRNKESSSLERLQFETEKESSSEKLRSEIDDKVLEDHTEETTYFVCLPKKVPEQQEIDESKWIYELAETTILSALVVVYASGMFYALFFSQ